MSRGQENEVNTTAGNQNATFNQNAQGSYNAAQNDVGDLAKSTAAFAAANPYGAGGAYQTAVNQSTANTADAASQAAGDALQGQAVRTGQNAAGSIGATQAIDEANTRNLMQTQANANANRISKGADYSAEALKAQQVPAQMEAQLSGQQAGAGNTSLETQQKAAETPDLGEELMGGVLSAGQAFAGGFGGGVGKSVCWIAAELYGGWEDPRTILFRLWLLFDFDNRWYGSPLVALYHLHGERVAGWIRRDFVLRAIFSNIFDRGLRQAEEWLATRPGRVALATHNQYRGAASRSYITLEALHGDR